MDTKKLSLIAAVASVVSSLAVSVPVALAQLTPTQVGSVISLQAGEYTKVGVLSQPQTDSSLNSKLMFRTIKIPHKAGKFTASRIRSSEIPQTTATAIWEVVTQNVPPTSPVFSMAYNSTTKWSLRAQLDPSQAPVNDVKLVKGYTPDLAFIRPLSNPLDPNMFTIILGDSDNGTYVLSSFDPLSGSQSQKVIPLPAPGNPNADASGVAFDGENLVACNQIIFKTNGFDVKVTSWKISGNTATVQATRILNDQLCPKNGIMKSGLYYAANRVFGGPLELLAIDPRTLNTVSSKLIANASPTLQTVDYAATILDNRYITAATDSVLYEKYLLAVDLGQGNGSTLVMVPEFSTKQNMVLGLFHKD